jgi:O-antigen ligase
MKFEKLYFYSLILMLALWIPLPILSSPTIALFGVIVIYGAIMKKLSFKWNWILFSFAMLYVMYVLYCIPSNNIGQATKDLEHKLSFLVFPILFSFLPNFELNRDKLLNTFTIGCLILGLYFVAQSTYHFMASGDSSYFHSSAFAPSHHPSYVAAFFSFAIYFLISEIHPTQSRKRTFSAITVISFLTFLHLPLESLSGVLIIGCLTAFLVLRWAWNTFSKWIFATFILLGLLSIQVIFWIQPSLKDNVAYTSSLVSHYVESPTKFIQETPSGMSGNQARLVVWTITGQIIADHPFGIGLGNLEGEMKQRLIQLDQHELVEKNYNPHNQFLQIAAEIGLVGLAFFVGILFFIVRFALQRKDELLVFLVFSLILNSLFESMLQRQSGIVFYVMLICAMVTVIRLPKPTAQ